MSLGVVEWLAVKTERCGPAGLRCYQKLPLLGRDAVTDLAHSQEYAMSVFFSSIAAKGLSRDVTLELVPLTCFVGLSGGGVAS